MRTNIDIDDELMAKALELSGLPTKKAVVEEALKLLVQSRKRRNVIEEMRGMGWEGDLDDHALQPFLILVDSSVWINNLRDIDTPGVRKLNAIRETNDIVLGDLILMEILMGAPSEGQAVRLREALVEFTVVSLSDASIAELAARNYRHLHSLGVTIRKSIDLVIGTFCIEHDHYLLHEDRDFEPMVRHLGLKIV